MPCSGLMVTDSVDRFVHSVVVGHVHYIHIMRIAL